MARAVFTQGSTLRHILVMTGASALGLIAIFTVDLVDMYFLSLLGQEELAAAIGFAGTLLFFLTSLCIGLQIAMGALVARAEGAHDRYQAGRYCSNVLIVTAMVSIALSLPSWFFLSEMLGFLGARGEVLQLALDYSQIILPTTILLSVGMCGAAALRAIGDAKRSMYVTFGAAIVNACLDPVFIFGFGWGIKGAAIASALARLTMIFIAFNGVFRVHKLPQAIGLQSLREDFRAIMTIAGPAVLTNMATPLGNSFVLKIMSGFGDSAVAGAAIMARVIPVTFAFIFSLSGAVGPVVGQNAGAGLYPRVRETVINAAMVNFVYVALMWLLLLLLRDWIIAAFSATGDAAYLIDFYCRFLVMGFAFNGMLFISNASFNNLNKAYMATAFNFSRVLFGTVPFVLLLSYFYGAVGVMAGELFGAVIFGSFAYLVILREIARLNRIQIKTYALEYSRHAGAQHNYSGDKQPLAEVPAEARSQSP